MAVRYDVLVVDLDGTLLNRAGQITDRNRHALRDAQQAGLEVIVATGRSWSESRRALERVGHDGVVIAAGGSVLADAQTGRTILRRVMSSEVIHEVASHLLADSHRVLILKDAHATGYDYITVGESDLDPASKWWFEHQGVEVRHLQSLGDDPHPGDSLRAGAVACSSRLEPLASRLKTCMSDRACFQHWSAVTSSHATGSPTHLLEVFSADVNKWTMLLEHCTARGIAAHRIAAIGDGLNDVELIENAGLGIAMGNSIPEVCAVADRRTSDHDHDGVAEAVTNILEGTW